MSSILRNVATGIKAVCLGLGCTTVPLLSYASHQVSHKAPAADIPLTAGTAFEAVFEISPDDSVSLNRVEAFILRETHREGNLLDFQQNFEIQGECELLSVDESGKHYYSYRFENIPSGGIAFGAYTEDAHGDTDWVFQPYTVEPFSAKINFQPDSILTPDGWERDFGSLYGENGASRDDGTVNAYGRNLLGGLVYGWNRNLSEGDQTYLRSNNDFDHLTDTGVFMRDAKGYESTWELQVPVGLYQIRLSVGDPNKPGRYHLAVEEHLIINQVTVADDLATSDIDESRINVEALVYVTDGRLTIRDLGGEIPAALNYIAVQHRGHFKDESAVYLRGPVAETQSDLNFENYQIAVRPLSRQRGVHQWEQGDSATNTFLYDLTEDDGAFAVSDPTNPYTEPLDLPIASFGTAQSQATPLYVGQEYGYAAVCGVIPKKVTTDQGPTTGGVFIAVYDSITGALISGERIDIDVALPVEASAGYFEHTDHGFSDNDVIQLSTTDTLPEGLSANTDYYVVVLNEDRFYVTDSLNGTPLPVSDTGIGEHSYTGGNKFTVHSNWYGALEQQHTEVISEHGLTTRFMVLPNEFGYTGKYPNYLLYHKGDETTLGKKYRVYAWGQFAENPDDWESSNLAYAAKDIGGNALFSSNGHAPVLLYEFELSEPDMLANHMTQLPFGPQPEPSQYAGDDFAEHANASFTNVEPFLFKHRDAALLDGEINFNMDGEAYMAEAYSGAWDFIFNLEEMSSFKILWRNGSPDAFNYLISPEKVYYAVNVDEQAGSFDIMEKRPDGSLAPLILRDRYPSVTGQYQFKRVYSVPSADVAAASTGFDKYDFTSIDNSTELRANSVLDTFADEHVSDPLFIANYVHNEIELVDFMHYNPFDRVGGAYATSIYEGGVRRNAGTVFRQGQGSPTEQCALLVYLFRKIGVPALYLFPQKDTLKVPSADLSQMFGISIEGQVDVPELVPVNYPWVMAWINGEWVHLFPWYKNQENSEGFDYHEVLPDSEQITLDFYRRYLDADSGLMSLTPWSDQVSDIWPVYIEEKIQASRGLSLTDVGMRRRERGVYRYNWSDFPRPILENNFRHRALKYAHQSDEFSAYAPQNFIEEVGLNLPLSGLNPIAYEKLTDHFSLGTQTTYTLFDEINIVLDDGNPFLNYPVFNRVPVADLNDRNIFWYWDDQSQDTIDDDVLIVGLGPSDGYDVTNPNNNISGDANYLYVSAPYLVPSEGDNTGDYPGLANSFLYQYPRSLHNLNNVAIRVEERINSRYRSLDNVFNGNGFEPYFWTTLLDGAISYLDNTINNYQLLDDHGKLRVTHGGPRLIRSGERGSICYFSGSVSERQKQEALEAYKVYKSAAQNAGTDSNQYKFMIGALSHLQGLMYHDANSKFQQLLEDIFKLRLITDRSVFKSYFRDYDKPTMDVYGLSKVYAMGAQASIGTQITATEALVRDFGILNGLQGSANEHGVLNRLYGTTDAVSTVKLLQLASTEPYYSNELDGYVTLNAFNYKGEGQESYYEFIGGANHPLSWYFGNAWDGTVKSFLSDPDARTEYRMVEVSPGFVYALDTDLSFAPNPPSPAPDEAHPFYAILTADLISGGNAYYISDGESVMNLGGYGGPIDPLNVVLLPNTEEYNLPFIEAAKERLKQKYQGLTDAEVDRVFSEALETTVGPEYTPDEVHVGDPVNVVTGAFYMDDTDIVLPGPFPLPIRRNYSSQNLYHGAFGWGWKFSFVDHLSLIPGFDTSSQKVDDFYITAAEMDGTVISYTKVASDRWEVTSAENPEISNNRSTGIGGLENPFQAYIERSVEGSDTVFYLYGSDGSTRRFLQRNLTSGSIDRDVPLLDFWKDSQGNQLNFEYYDSAEDAQTSQYALLRRIESSNGNYLIFNYTLARQISEIRTNDARVVKYVYDDFNDLSEVHLPDGSVVKYNYLLSDQDNSLPSQTVDWYSTHLLSSIIQPDGRILENDYDSARRVLEQRATVGDDMVPIRNASYIYSGDISSGWTRVYDVFAQPSQTPATDTNCTLYEYSDGLITRIVDEIGQEIQKTYYTTAGTYPDPTGTYNETAKTLPLIATAHGPSDPGDYHRSLMRTEDKRGLVTYFWYDDSGNVVLKKIFGDLDGEPGTIEEAAYSYEYNVRNLLTKSVDPANIEKRIDYEDIDYPYLPTKVEHYAQGVLVSTNTSIYGEEVASVSGEFAKGLLKRDSKAVNSIDAAYTEWQYDTRGYVIGLHQYVNTGTTTPVADVTLDPTSTFIRNDRGEVVIEKVLGAGGATSIERHFEYDNMSRMITKTIRDGSGTTLSTRRFYYNGNGELSWTDGPRTGIQDYVFRDYDGAGRIVSESTWRSEAIPDGSGIREVAGQDSFDGQAIRTFDYDGFGNLERTYDPRGNYLAHNYDAIGQLTETSSYAADGTLLATEIFDQEPGGQLSFYQNPLTGITRKFYTGTGLLRREERPDGSVAEWRYNTDGRVDREYLRNGYYWQYTYDDPNRSITKQFHNPDGTPYLDANNRTHIESTEFDRRGNVVKATNRVGLVTTTTFDGLNRPVTTAGSGGAVAPYTDEQSGNYSYSRDGLMVTQTNALNESTITVNDALGRPLSISVRDSSNSLVRLSSLEYAADHNSVQITEGDPTAAGESLIRRTEFTNTFGQIVLVRKHTDQANFDYELSSFDKAGNLIASEDALRQTTHYTYDGLNRMATSVLPDGATTEYRYDDAGNLTQRIMPGGLSEERQFDAANRIQSTKLTKGAATTRHTTFTYKPSGNANVGLPAGETDQIRGDSRSFDTYDPLLRLTDMTATGVQPVGEPTVYGYSRLYRYDPRGLVESSKLTYSAPELAAASIEVKNLYDGYGQPYEEETLIDDVSHNRFNQYWDAVGRRDQLDTNLTALSRYNFQWYADGNLKQVQAVETSPVRQSDFDFSYDRSGLLKTRSNQWRDVTITQRDQRGRELSRSLTAHTVSGISTVMAETMQWRADSKLANYTVNRSGTGVWNESRDYIYNARGQLVSESYAPQVGELATVAYNFDDDQLGVLTRADTYGDTNHLWEIPNGQLDGFARMLQEATYGNKEIPAHGYAEGAASVDVVLYDDFNEREVEGVAFTGVANNWRWDADLQLSAGSYELGVTAHHPSGAFESEEVRSAFTVTDTPAKLVDITYDEAGYTQQRSFSDGRIETFYWDVRGSLLRIESRDSANDGYDFDCIYDTRGRRLKTVKTPVLADVLQTSGVITETCYYDPQVEFLSLMVAINGDRQWKVHGPDLNGAYGALEGIGGVEAVYREAGTQWYAAVGDRFGNLLASIEEAGAADVLVWSDTRVGGYGAMAGGQLKAFGTNDSAMESTALIETLVWRSHRLDATGYICMGDRYYDPVSARFLSPDPYGHGASMDLYSYAGGDPINFVDPTGRWNIGVNGQGSAVYTGPAYGGNRGYYRGGAVAYEVARTGEYSRSYDVAVHRYTDDNGSEISILESEGNVVIKLTDNGGISLSGGANAYIYSNESSGGEVNVTGVEVNGSYELSSENISAGFNAEAHGVKINAGGAFEAGDYSGEVDFHQNWFNARATANGGVNWSGSNQGLGVKAGAIANVFDTGLKIDITKPDGSPFSISGSVTALGPPSGIVGGEYYENKGASVGAKIAQPGFAGGIKISGPAIPKRDPVQGKNPKYRQ